MRLIILTVEWTPPAAGMARSGWELMIERCLNQIRGDFHNGEYFIGAIQVLVPLYTGVRTIYAIYRIVRRVFPSQYIHVSVIPKLKNISAEILQSELLFQWPAEILEFWGSDLISRKYSIEDVDHVCPDGGINEDINVEWEEEDGEKCRIDEEKFIEASGKELFAFGGSFDGLHIGHLMALHTLMSLVCGDGKNSGLKGKLIAFGISEDSVVQSKSNGYCGRDFETRVDSLDRAMSCLLKSSGFHLTDDWEEFTLLPHIEAIRSRYTTCLERLWQHDGIDSVQLAVVYTSLDGGGVGVAAYEELEVLVVSPETVKGAVYVNELRKKYGSDELLVCVCPLVLRSVDRKISSSDEREMLDMILKMYDPNRDELSLRMRSYVRHIILPLYDEELGNESNNSIGVSNMSLLLNRALCRLNEKQQKLLCLE